MPSLTTDRIVGLSTSVAVKAPVKTVATSAVTQSGEQTIGGISCVKGDRVLCTAQASSVNNGIWEVRVGAWRRAPDFDGPRDVRKGTIVWSENPGADGSFWQVTSENPNNIGQSAVTFRQNYHIGNDSVAVVDTNISVTVGTGGDFATINEALTYLAGGHPGYVRGGYTGTITLLSGFVMAEEIHLMRGENFGWVKIVAQDPVVTIQRSALTTYLGNTYNTATLGTFGSYQMPMSAGVPFAGYGGAVMPVIGCLFSMDTSGDTNRNYYGLSLQGGCHATVLWGCGITNVVKPSTGRSGRGAAITHGSTLMGYGSIWDGCQIGVRVSNASKANVREGSAKNCEYAIDVNGASEVACQGMDLSGCTFHAVMALGHSTARASECDMTNCGVGGSTSLDYATIYADAGATVDANSADISGGQRGIQAQGGALVTFSNGVCTSMEGIVLIANNGAKIVADYCSISGCESEGAVTAGLAGEIVLRGASITNNPLVSGVYAYGGTIYAQDATITGSKNSVGDFDIRVRDNGQVFAFGANTTNGGGTAVAVADCSISRLNERTASGAVWTSDASILSGSKTHDFGSLADGAGETTTVTVTGAALGDFVEAVSLSVDLQSCTLVGWVSAADTVSVRLLNESGGGPIDLASATLRARVRKA